MMAKVIVIGIGQQMRGDDAVGVKVVQLWATQHPERLASSQIEMALVPLPGLGLLDQISEYEYAILVDAVLGGPGVSPGSLLYLTPNNLVGFSGGASSTHGWGVAEAFQLAEVLGIKDLPKQITILGIGGKQVEIGATLSPEVAEVLPEAVTAIERLIAQYLD